MLTFSTLFEVFDPMVRNIIELEEENQKEIIGNVMSGNESAFPNSDDEHDDDNKSRNRIVLSGGLMNDDGEEILQKDYLDSLKWDGPKEEPSSPMELLKHPVRGVKYLVNNSGTADLVRDQYGNIWISTEDGRRFPWDPNGDWYKNNPDLAGSITEPREMPAINPINIAASSIGGGVGTKLAGPVIKHTAEKVLKHELGKIGSYSTNYIAKQVGKQPLTAIIN